MELLQLSKEGEAIDVNGQDNSAGQGNCYQT